MNYNMPIKKAKDYQCTKVLNLFKTIQKSKLKNKTTFKLFEKGITFFFYDKEEFLLKNRKTLMEAFYPIQLAY